MLKFLYFSVIIIDVFLVPLASGCARQNWFLMFVTFVKDLKSIIWEYFGILTYPKVIDVRISDNMGLQCSDLHFGWEYLCYKRAYA